jgi:hypothetical protein
MSDDRDPNKSIPPEATATTERAPEAAAPTAEGNTDEHQPVDEAAYKRALEAADAYQKALETERAAPTEAIELDPTVAITLDDVIGGALDSAAAEVEPTVDMAAEAKPAPADPVEPTLMVDAATGRPMTPEEVYHAHIEPLMQSIVSICQRAGMGFAIAIDATNHDDPAAPTCTPMAAGVGHRTAHVVQYAAMAIAPPPGVLVRPISTKSWFRDNAGRNGTDPS